MPKTAIPSVLRTAATAGAVTLPGELPERESVVETIPAAPFGTVLAPSAAATGGSFPAAPFGATLATSAAALSGALPASPFAAVLRPLDGDVTFSDRVGPILARTWGTAPVLYADFASTTGVHSDAGGTTQAGDTDAVENLEDLIGTTDLISGTGASGPEFDATAKHGTFDGVGEGLFTTGIGAASGSKVVFYFYGALTSLASTATDNNIFFGSEAFVGAGQRGGGWGFWQLSGAPAGQAVLRIAGSVTAGNITYTGLPSTTALWRIEVDTSTGTGTLQVDGVTISGTNDGVWDGAVAQAERTLVLGNGRNGSSAWLGAWSAMDAELAMMFQGDPSAEDDYFIQQSVGLVSPIVDTRADIAAYSFDRLTLRHIVSGWNVGGASDGAEVTSLPDYTGSADMTPATSTGPTYSSALKSLTFDGTRKLRAGSDVETTKRRAVIGLDMTDVSFLTSSSGNAEFVLSTGYVAGAAETRVPGAMTIQRNTAADASNTIRCVLVCGSGGFIHWTFALSGGPGYWTVYYDADAALVRFWENGVEIPGVLADLGGNPNDSFKLRTNPAGRLALGDSHDGTNWEGKTAEFALRSVEIFDCAPGAPTVDDIQYLVSKHGRTVSLPSVTLGDIHVATTGNDTTGDGSSSTPYATIQKAVDRAKAGDGNRILVNSTQTFTSGVAVTDWLGSPLREFIIDGETWPGTGGTRATIQMGHKIETWTLNRTLANGRPVWRATTPADVRWDVETFNVWCDEVAVLAAGPATPTDARDFTDKDGWLFAAANGTTDSIVDSDLIGLSNTDAMWVLIYYSPNHQVRRPVLTYDSVTGTITFAAVGSMPTTGTVTYTIFNCDNPSGTFFNRNNQYLYDDVNNYIEFIPVDDADNPNSSEFYITHRGQGASGIPFEFDECEYVRVRGFNVRYHLYSIARANYETDTTRSRNIVLERVDARYGGDGVRWGLTTDCGVDECEFHDLMEVYQSKSSAYRKNVNNWIRDTNITRAYLGITFYYTARPTLANVTIGACLYTHANSLTVYNASHGLRVAGSNITGGDSPRIGHSMNTIVGGVYVLSRFTGGTYPVTDWTGIDGTNREFYCTTIQGTMYRVAVNWDNAVLRNCIIENVNLTAANTGIGGYSGSPNIWGAGGAMTSRTGNILVDWSTLFGGNWPTPTALSFTGTGGTLHLLDDAATIDLTEEYGVTLAHIGQLKPNVAGTEWTLPAVDVVI